MRDAGWEGLLLGGLLDQPTTDSDVVSTSRPPVPPSTHALAWRPSPPSHPGWRRIQGFQGPSRCQSKSSMDHVPDGPRGSKEGRGQGSEMLYLGRTPVCPA